MHNQKLIVHKGVLICGLFYIDLLDKQYFTQELAEWQDRFLWGLRPT